MTPACFAIYGESNKCYIKEEEAVYLWSERKQEEFGAVRLLSIRAYLERARESDGYSR